MGHYYLALFFGCSIISFNKIEIVCLSIFVPHSCDMVEQRSDRMEKSFYYSVEWSEVGYLKEALNAMEIPYVIEQDSDRLQLDAGHVAMRFQG